MHSQVALKHDMHQELILRFREYIESALAVSLLSKLDLFTSVKKISNAILKFIQSHKEDLIQKTEKNPKIREELCQEKYFGHLNETKENASSADLIAAVENTLTAPPSLAEVMQIHSVFFYRLHEGMATEPENLLPDAGNRGRLLLDQPMTLTQQLGITRHPVFSKRIGRGAFHARAIDRFTPETTSSFVQAMQHHNQPYVAGPSFHTCTLLAGAKALGEFNEDELKEYALAVFAFLAAGGNHSFHEVMIIAKALGVPHAFSDDPRDLPELKGAELG